MSQFPPWGPWPPAPPPEPPDPELATLEIGLAGLVQLFSNALAGGAFVDIPGPAAGSVRIFDGMFLSSQVPGAAANTITIQQRPQLMAFGQTTAVGTTQGFTRFVLGVGETLRVTNGGVNTLALAVTYIDYPSTDIVLVRTTLTNALATVIPAASAGFAHRWLQFGALSSPFGSRAVECKLHAWNPDNATHTIETAMAGVVLGRSGNMLTNTGLAPVTSVQQARVTASPLQMRMGEALVTVGVNLFGAYQKIAL